MRRPVHDAALLDALQAMPAERFDGTVWRVARVGRDALTGSVGSGRWAPDDRSEILYTCLERDGALSEVGFRLSLEPVWPSRLSHEIHALEARANQTLRFADVTSLVPLGVDAARWSGFDYVATQAVAAATHFLEYDGMIVPSAQAECANLVVFLDRAVGLAATHSEPVDWTVWRRAALMDKRRYP